MDKIIIILINICSGLKAGREDLIKNITGVVTLLLDPRKKG